MEPSKTLDDQNESDRFRQILRNEYGVRSVFIRVSKLSEILGVGSRMIYASMRESRFWMPHRLIGTAPVVRTEDLVAWYCRPPPEREADIERCVAIATDSQNEGRLDIMRKSARQALDKDLRDAIVSSTLRSMKS